MILQFGDSKVTVLPIIKGLVSEYDRVLSKITDEYDCIAVSLGLEEIEAIKQADSGEWEYDPSKLESVYAHNLKQFGEINIPVPAYKAVTDGCAKLNTEPMPLDMCDEEYTKMYCDCVSTFDILKENRLLKKAMKTSFDMSSPEAFVKQWDSMVNTIKGQNAVSLRREEYIANQLRDLTKYKKNILAVIETERISGILKELGIDGM